MNLRTHTYAIPALFGFASFALLVAADFSVHRFVNGPGYGPRDYVAERAGGAPPMAMAELAPRPRLVIAAPEDLAVEVESIAAVARDPLASDVVRPVSEPEPEILAGEIAPAMPAPVAPEADFAAFEGGAVEATGGRPLCTTERGFKRCRVAD